MSGENNQPKHLMECPINNVLIELYGPPGQGGGLKADVQEIKTATVNIHRCVKDLSAEVKVVQENLTKMTAIKQNSPITDFASFIKKVWQNWKALSIAALFLMMLWGRVTTGKKITVAEMKDFIQQFKQIEQEETKPAAKTDETKKENGG